MKKHILMASVAVLALGLASAAGAEPRVNNNPEWTDQYIVPGANSNSSTVTEDGSNNKANIEQIAGTTTPNTNVSEVKQFGTGNRVGNPDSDPAWLGVRQAGQGNVNKSYIDQGTAEDHSDHNAAVVRQNGSGNLNTSAIRQIGNGFGKADVRQAGSSNINWSKVTQTGAGAGWNSRNVANVRQGFDSEDGDNWSKITQEGAGNTANVTQSGSGENTSDLTQNGDSNTASVTQSGDGINDSTVTQTTSTSTATVLQASLTGMTNTSTVTQTGAGGHSAYVNQH